MRFWPGYALLLPGTPYRNDGQPALEPYRIEGWTTLTITKANDEDQPFWIGIAQTQPSAKLHEPALRPVTRGGLNSAGRRSAASDVELRAMAWVTTYAVRSS